MSLLFFIRISFLKITTFLLSLKKRKKKILHCFQSGKSLKGFASNYLTRSFASLNKHSCLKEQGSYCWVFSHQEGAPYFYFFYAVDLGIIHPLNSFPGILYVRLPNGAWSVYISFFHSYCANYIINCNNCQ